MENNISRIVVYGGSFNPPTAAHERLLKAAVEGVGADLGVFVPSNGAYVTKKMAKTDWPSAVLSERTRSAMLRAVCAGDGRLSVDEGEYGFSGTSGNSIDTMKRIRAQYPDAEALYFLFGGDKLKTFAKWKTFREFCESFGIIVFRREGFDPEAEIEHTKALREFRDSFVILPAPEGLDAISSTAVRDAVRRGDEETAKSMLSPGVFDLLAGTPVRKETAVTSFRGKYAFLSNFYAAEVTFEGMTYPTNEAAFQAAKCLDPELFLPPLLSPKDFDDFVFKYDKPICDLIHEHGGYVWVHSHGQVRNFIERFIEMGVDVLNPLEPVWASNGDVDLDEVVKTFGGRIGLEGNIEIQEILQSSKERIAELIDACVAAGWKSGRMILCPSAGYMEYPRPTEKYIENLLFYLRYGLEAVERCRK